MAGSAAKAAGSAAALAKGSVATAVAGVEGKAGEGEAVYTAASEEGVEGKAE